MTSEAVTPSDDLFDIVTTDQALSGSPREWILDIYGSFVREFGGWIAVSDLLLLLEALDVASSSSRASISRMKQKGVLQSDLRDGRKGYSLTPDADEWFNDGTARILGGRIEADKSRWLLASFSVPERDRGSRYKIRSRLQGLGFGPVSGGLMIAPAALFEESRRALVRADLDKYVTLWHAEHAGFSSVKDLISEAWDIGAIARAYDEYLEIAMQVEAQGAPITDQDAFVRYMVNINAWRELPFLDPGLPRSLLPADWPAGEAVETFRRLAASLRAQAWRFVIALLAGDDDRPVRR